MKKQSYKTSTEETIALTDVMRAVNLPSDMSIFDGSDSVVPSEKAPRRVMISTGRMKKRSCVKDKSGL